MRTTKAKKLRQQKEKTMGYVPNRKMSDGSLLTRRTKTKKDRMNQSFSKHRKSMYQAG